jgi:hypothetical protein
MTWTLIRKFLVALAGAASLAITQGLISGTAAQWTAIGIGLATAAGVYLVPNRPAPPATPEPAAPAAAPKPDSYPPGA